MVGGEGGEGEGGKGKEGRPEYSNLGPTYDACRFKNLHVDKVIEALDREREKLEPAREASKGKGREGRAPSASTVTVSPSRGSRSCY